MGQQKANNNVSNIADSVGASPLQRLTQLEQLMVKSIYPRLAELTHQSLVNNRIIELLLAGRRPTITEIERITEDAARATEGMIPGIKIATRRGATQLITPNGVVNVYQDSKNDANPG